MSRNSFTQLTTGNAATDQQMGYIATALNPLLQLPFASGNRVKDVELTTADVYVNHGLEQEPEGWIILKKNAAHSIYKSATTNDYPNTMIIMKAAGTITADIFFF